MGHLDHGSCLINNPPNYGIPKIDKNSLSFFPILMIICSNLLWFFLVQSYDITFFKIIFRQQQYPDKFWMIVDNEIFFRQNNIILHSSINLLNQT